MRELGESPKVRGTIGHWLLVTVGPWANPFLSLDLGLHVNKNNNHSDNYNNNNCWILIVITDCMYLLSAYITLFEHPNNNCEIGISIHPSLQGETEAQDVK